MIGRWSSKSGRKDADDAQGFDAFELRLGDIMRGERATLGKSLLDVQRELRIKASYIAAIENADPDAFDTPGFIAGYVRSYARYLNMDADVAFDAFCAESGFSVAHGMSAEASVVKKPSVEERANSRKDTKRSEHDLFSRPATPFTPARDSLFSRVEPAAVGSILVLVALIGGLGYGGYSVLQEVQRVQVAPVDQTPVVLSDLDPLDGALSQAPVASSDSSAPDAFEAPRADALDRLYRPQALDVPVIVAPRDAPIASIDPRTAGSFGAPSPAAPALGTAPNADTLVAGVDGATTEGEAHTFAGSGNLPRVLERAPATVLMVATEESWVQVKSADGSVIYEAVLQKGDTWEVPATEEPPKLRTGQAGAIFFAMNDQLYGPVGARGSVKSNVALDHLAVAEVYQPVVIEENTRLATMVAELRQAEQAQDTAVEGEATSPTTPDIE